MCRQLLRYMFFDDLISSDLSMFTQVFLSHLDSFQIHVAVLDEQMSTPLHSSSCSSSIYSITWKCEEAVRLNPNRASPTEWMLGGSSLNFLVAGLQTTQRYKPSTPWHKHRMSPLQISEMATLTKLKGKKDKQGCSTVTLVQCRWPQWVSYKKPARLRDRTLWLLQFEMRQFQERQTHLQQNKERAERRRRISTTASSVRLASVFLLLGASSISSVESLLSNEITQEENNPTKIHQ